ncbi:hypothetical protein FQN57_004944 [Myotisia sp. PD_48]|nr:hypothetical protein FQN57_004944 [Myotisia sp. PD_48]
METYHGHVRTPGDAIILFEACRIGQLPRVQRRLSEKERQSIKSGSVFVWDEREAGMRRWTDGKSWSASRVSGSFLTYREMEGKRGGAHASQARAGKTPESSKGSDEDQGEGAEEGPDGYRYKPDGLMKQSFSITTSTGQHLHLISYYARSHPTAPGLNQPSTDGSLRHIVPQKGLYPESSVHDQQNLPVVTRGPMPSATYSVPPPMTHYGRSPAAHSHSYAPAPYAWPGPMAGQHHIPVVPYVPNYLPPIPGTSGHHPYPYGQHHQYAPQHAYPPQYERVHPAESYATPPAIHGHNSQAPTHPYPPYAAPRQPALVGPTTNSHPMVGQIDPRLGASPSVSSQETPNSQRRRSSVNSSPPPDPRSPAAQPPVTVTQNGTGSEATTTSSIAVPSINALMNSPAPSNTSQPPGYQPNGTRDTISTATGEGPKDIPSDKIGFGEDMRALRQLDRVFTA